MGFKLIIVAELCLAMAIPALFVDRMVSNRAQRATTVQNEIDSTVGGQETFLGPVLAAT